VSEALGSSLGSATLCCVVLCKSLDLSELFPIYTSKKSDWVFSFFYIIAFTFFHYLAGAGEDSGWGAGSLQPSQMGKGARLGGGA